MAYNPPRYDKLLRRKFRRFVKGWLKKNLTPIQDGEFLEYEDWLASTNYPEWRKNELREVYKKMNEDNSFFCNEVDRLHKNADVKIFMKEENYPEYKLPRAIWARVDEFKVISGPFFKTIEKQLFKLDYFIKKVPKKDRPQYIIDKIKKEGMLYMCTDYTSFESLFTTDMQDDCEFQLYRYMSTKNFYMQRIVNMIFQVLCGDNVCGNKYFKVAVDAKRMSGEMNTSLGNGFSNLMFTLFALDYYKIGHSGIVVEGDDGLTGLERPIPAEYFTKMGLNVKMEVKSDVTEASFCGIISDCDELINITEPLQHLCFVPWVSSKYAFSSRYKYFGLLKSKALSLAYEYPGCPILDVYARKMLELLVDFKICHDQQDKWKLKIAEEAEEAMKKGDFPTRNTGPRTRELMEKYFQIPQSTQLLIEAKIKNMTLFHWDYSDILPLIPEQWKTHYDKYMYEWKNQTQWSIRRPPMPIGNKKIEFVLNRCKGAILRNMNQTLTEKQYFKLNEKNFKGLSQRDKQEKYANYLLGKKDKQQRLGRVGRTKVTNTVKKRPKRNAKPMRTAATLSDCTMLYARASIDPFSRLEKDPCIPDSICAPSYKFNTTLMATMYVGTAGTGYAVLQPLLAAINDNAVNATSIDYPLSVTTAAYGDPNYIMAPVFYPAAITGVNSNSYFTDALFQNAEIRLVAAGMECFYTGTVLNQAGTVTTLQNDGFTPIVSGTTAAAIMSNPKSTVCSTSKDSRCYISYYPTDSEQFSYKRFENLRPSTNGDSNYYAMIIFVSGAQPGTTFQIKARCYYEAQIPGLSSTESESDPLGFSAVAAARTKIRPTDDPKTDFLETVKESLRILGTQMSGLAPAIGGAVGTAFGVPEVGITLGNAASYALNTLLK
jgi:hypothetical protein